MTSRPQTNRTARFVGILALSVIAACGAETKQKQLFGSAKFNVTTEALDQGDILAVTVDLTPVLAEGTVSLANTSQGWTGIIGQIPVGSTTFDVKAYNSLTLIPANLIYEGSATQTISEGTTIVVDVALQQTAAAVPFTDTAPVITSMTASSNAVGPGDTVSLNAVEVDPDSGDVDTVVWSATGGTFPGGTAGGGPFDGDTGAQTTSTTWTAPGTPGNYDVTVTVTDASGAFAAVTLTINVAVENASGAANLNLTFNTWPSVNGVTATPDLVAPSGTTSLGVSASDPEVTAGWQSLNYSWSDGGCGGTFTPSANVQSPTYTAAASGPSSCTLTVTVTDEVIASGLPAGGTNTGALTISIGSAPGGEFAPSFTSSFQTQGTVDGGGDTVTFTVDATDPQSSSLSFSWATNADDGASLGTATNTTSTSQVTFTAGCGDATYTVTVTVTDGDGLSTSYTFDIANTEMEC